MEKQELIALVDANAVFHQVWWQEPIRGLKEYPDTQESVNENIGLILACFLLHTAHAISDIERWRLRSKFVKTVMLWDGKHSSKWRKECYPEYKAGRERGENKYTTPRNGISAMRNSILGISKKFSASFDYWEADDAIAHYANHFANDGHEVAIVTTDYDLWQCINPLVSVYALAGKLKGGRITEEQCKQVFGVSPDRVVDYKALVGDSSDNYKGIPGIGPKKAINLLNGDPSVYCESEEYKLCRYLAKLPFGALNDPDNTEGNITGTEFDVVVREQFNVSPDYSELKRLGFSDENIDRIVSCLY